MSEDQFIEDALEAGADDVETEDDVFVYIATPPAFTKWQPREKYSISEAEIVISQTTVKLEENLEKFLKMIECFEDLDDVQNVYHNIELPEEAE